MPTVTLSIEKELLDAGRQYAKRHNTSLKRLIRDMLKQKVSGNIESVKQELFTLLDNASGDSKGYSWKRDELY